MSNKMTPAAEKRAAKFEEMTPALQKVAEKCRVLVTKEARGNVLVRYELGLNIKQVIGDSDENPVYGANAVGQLADYMNKTETELYDLRSFVTAFERTEVEELCQREMENGEHVSLGHFLAIMRVPKAADRKMLWKRVFAESLGVNVVANEVAATYEKVNKRSGGRKPAKPTSPVAGVQQIVEATGLLINRQTVWQESVYDQIAELEADRCDPQIAEKLIKAIANMDKITEELGNDRNKLYKAWERVDGIVTKRTAEQSKEAKAEEKAIEGKGKAKGRKPVAA